MTSRPAGTLARIVERRAFVLEPLALISFIALASTWAIQPYVAHALAQQGAAAQGAAQAAIWFSGVLSPLSAFFKALTAALVCWACAVWLDERLPLLKLVSMFCVGEIVHSLRDLTMLGVLAARGLGSVRATSDLMVAFGLNAFLHPASSLARVGFESWDIFSVAWGLAIFFMLRALFGTETRSAAVLAMLAFVFRTLFAAASLLYTL